MSNERNQWHNLCGLWLSKDKTSMGGNLGMARIGVFKNNNKRGDNSPDYWLAVTRGEERKERRVYGEQAPQQASEAQPEEPSYDDIPF